MQAKPGDIAQLLFPEAAEVWLVSRTAYICGKTYHEYELNIRTLSAFFGQTKLAEITADQIRAYQTMRHEHCGPAVFAKASAPGARLYDTISILLTLCHMATGVTSSRRF